MSRESRVPEPASTKRPPPGRKLTASSLENAALHYLERFASSAANLRRVLMRRVKRSAEAHGTDPAEGAALVEALIARLVKGGLLDDRAYAQAKAASLHRRGASRRVISGRLAQRGVEGELIAAAIDDIEEETGNADLTAACALARRRRLGPYRQAAARADQRTRDLGAFARAGFSLDVARRVLDCPDADAVEALARGEAESR
jgi:regulatory protein